MPNEETFEIISTHQSLTQRAKHHKHVLSHFTNQWKREYLLSLREHHLQKCRKEGKSSIELGDVVILKSDLSNRAFWRLGVVERLLPGSDEKVRAAIVKVGDKSGSQCTIFLKCSIKHLYPIEVKSQVSKSSESEPKEPHLRSADCGSDRSSTMVSDDNSTVAVPEASSSATVDGANSRSRPRRQAAIAGERLCRNKPHYFHLLNVLG